MSIVFSVFAAHQAIDVQSSVLLQFIFFHEGVQNLTKLSKTRQKNEIVIQKKKSITLTGEMRDEIERDTGDSQMK